MNIVKESLAKLLATENLIVEHRPVDTAMFDVISRVLTLPTWEHENNDVVDMFIAHEVGHALYTPNDTDWLAEVNQQFLNVTEDIRIEKLIKRRYQGLPKTFFRGYQSLDIDEFFGIADTDLSTLNLADKINLQYKIGNYRDIPFTSEEAAFLPKCDALETFDEAIALAKEIQTYCKEQLEKQQKQESPKQEEAQEQPSDDKDQNPSSTQSDSSNTPQDTPEQGETKEEPQDTPFDDMQPVDIDKDKAEETGRQEPLEEGAPSSAGRGNGPQDASTPTVTTAQAAEYSQKKLVNKAVDNTYVEVPNKIAIDYLISNDEVTTYMDQFYAEKDAVRNRKDFADDWDLTQARNVINDMDQTLELFRQFKVSNAKEVNYLVKEFEMKKAADGYARATTSRTGVLDTANLHTYKYNDDLFKKITTIPDAKSHGLIFNIDWSGSMHHNIFDTIKQTLTLVSFCRKVGIDYDVYLFTDAWKKHGSYHDVADESMINGKVILDNFNMINVLTSGVNNRKHDHQALNLFRLAYSISNSYGRCMTPYNLFMGGTPLNESLIAINELIPTFKKRTGAQKIHVVCLTDGDGASLRCGKKYVDREGTESMFASHMGAGHILRDRKTGRMYSFEGGYYHSQTKQFVTWLRDRHPDCSFMNIRLLSQGEWHRFKSDCFDNLEYSEQRVLEANAQWKKTKTFICATSYWTIQYGLATAALKNNAEFEVEESATKAQIKRAFTKSLSGKKMNKKILSSFIDQIA